MLDEIQLNEFTNYLFDDPRTAQKAALIFKALLKAQSPRLARIAAQMGPSAAAAYKMIQRFLASCDPRLALQRLFQADAPFVLVDVTEMPRPNARRTDYVGLLQDGTTRGYWLFVLATPCRGRAIPFHCVTYSSQTINQHGTSRNQEHCRALAAVKELIGDKPLVLDREFSYLSLLETLTEEGLHFVIRLKVGAHPVRLVDGEGQPLQPVIQPRQKCIYRDVWYLGRVRVNLIGYWAPGLHEPLWVMTDLEPERALALYQQRMKIEESFRDAKTLLHLTQAMNQRQENLEKMLALTLLAYTIGLLLGEAVRDVAYGGVDPGAIDLERLTTSPTTPVSRKWCLYAGLFVFLKQQPKLPHGVLQRTVQQVVRAFACLVLPTPVRTFV